LKEFTSAERSAILRGAREACATATDLRMTLAQLLSAATVLRGEATLLRGESLRLRDRARVDRDGRQGS
jgi:hypothetical protein